MNDLITFSNHGAEELYGWTAHQAIGQPIHELTQSPSLVSLDKIRGEMLRSGHWQGELQRVRNDGTTVIISSRWALWRDAKGKTRAVLATNNDITVRRLSGTTPGEIRCLVRIHGRNPKSVGRLSNEGLTFRAPRFNLDKLKKPVCTGLRAP